MQTKGFAEINKDVELISYLSKVEVDKSTLLTIIFSDVLVIWIKRKSYN